MSCSCEKPRINVDPRKAGWCAHCLKEFDPAWLSNDKTVGRFFDRLAAGIFPGKPDRVFEEFRGLCEDRENAGRKKFGLAYLSRQNLWEAAEEEADACMYRHLRMLQRFREEGDEEGISLILEASRKSFEAFRLDREAESKFRGCP